MIRQPALLFLTLFKRLLDSLLSLLQLMFRRPLATLFLLQLDRRRGFFRGGEVLRQALFPPPLFLLRALALFILQVRALLHLLLSPALVVFRQGVDSHAEDLDWPRNVLDVMVAQILEV